MYQPCEIRFGFEFEAERLATGFGSVYFKIDKAQRHQYWTFDVGRSMFDVQSVLCSGYLKLYTRCHSTIAIRHSAGLLSS